jgi:hypothetical protein
MACLAVHFVFYPSTPQNGQFPILENPGNPGTFTCNFGRRLTQEKPGKSGDVFTGQIGA